MIVRQIIELLAPSSCLNCGIQGSDICSKCINDMSGHKRGVCYECNSLMPNGKTCTRCMKRSSLSGVAIGAYYDGAIKELILKLKFHRSYSAAKIAAEIIYTAKLPLDRISIITSVPISPQRYRERGYNQSELIAKALAKRTGLPYRSLLTRSNSGHQMGRSRPERLVAVQGAFVASKTLANESILIVDDVITTGATLNECAGVLRAAGAKRIWGAVVARH